MDKSFAAAAAIHVDGTESTVNSSATDRPNSITRVDSAIDGAAAAANSSGVRVLELHEWKEAALSLAEAFAEDHSSMYFLDTPDRAHWTKQQKWDLHRQIMEYVTYAHLLKGLVISAGPNYDCVGLW